MAKRKFDESKVKRDESGRFASAKGIGKQHDLKQIMSKGHPKQGGNLRHVKPHPKQGGGLRNVKTHPKQGGNLKGVKTHPKQGGNLGHVKTHKARKWGLR